MDSCLLASLKRRRSGRADRLGRLEATEASARLHGGFGRAAALHFHGAPDGLDVGEGAIRIADGIKRLPRPPQFRPKLPPGLWNCFQSRASRNETTSFWRSSTVSADFLTIPKDNPTNLHLWKRLRQASRRRTNGCFSS